MPSRPDLAGLGYGVLAVIDTALAGAGPTSKRLRRLTKPLLMPVLMAAFTAATPGRQDALRRGTLAAEAFSWAGDVALLGSSRRAFLAGVGSFAAAHVAYSAGFVAARKRGSDVAGPGTAAAVASWLVLTPVVATAAGKRDPALRIPVAGYATLLCTMFAASTRLDPSFPADVRRRIVLGTSLFLVSDTVLAVNKFLRSDPDARLDAFVMATYTAGQWLIADGVAHTAGPQSAV